MEAWRKPFKAYGTANFVVEGDRKTKENTRLMKKTIAIVNLVLTVALLGSPTRGNLGGRHSQYVPQQAEDNSFYVTDGLVAMWDGLWNVGVETHDSSAAVWIDLVNGREYIGKNFYWEDDAIVTTGGTLNDCRFVFSDLIGAERTREIVFQPISVGFGNDPAMRGTGDASLDFALWGARSPSLVAFFRNGHTFWTGVGDEIYKKRSLSVVNQLNTTSGYVDGSLTKDVRQYFAQQGEMVFPMYAFNQFRIFAVRVYDRALTDKEIAHNHAIDVERFGL